MPPLGHRPTGTAPCTLGGDSTYDRGIDYGPIGASTQSAANLPPLTALSHGWQRDELNRPMFDILCRFVRAGWSQLTPGVDPAPLIFPPREGGFGAYWATWEPEYPFTGSSAPSAAPERSPVWFNTSHRATTIEAEASLMVGSTRWPSAIGSPWHFGHYDVPAIFQAGRDGVPHPTLRRAMELQSWLRVGRNWFVLEQDSGIHALDPTATFTGTVFGGDRVQAQTIGLAIRVLRAALPRLHRWAAFDATDPSRSSTALGREGLSRFWFDARPDATHQPQGWLVARMRAWANGEAGQPIHIIVDPQGVVGGSSGGNVIRLSPGLVRAEPIASLIDRARLHWALKTYGPGSVPWFDPDGSAYRSSTYRWIARQAMKRAAAGLARLASFIAHELMHLVWRTDFNYRGGEGAGWIDQYLAGPADGHGHPWESECDGPPFSADQLRLYRFEHNSAREPASERSKHWFTRLFQLFVEGMLVHDLEGVLLAQDARWFAPGQHCGDHVWP